MNNRPLHLKLVAVTLFLLLVAVGVGAVNLTSVSVEQGDTLWLSQDPQIAAECDPGSVVTPHSVYVENVTRDGIVFPAGEDLLFDHDTNNDYFLSDFKSFIEKKDSYTAGVYTFFVACEDADGTDLDRVQHSFMVKTLELALVSGLEETMYAGDVAKVNATLKEVGEGSPHVIGAGEDPSFSVDGVFNSNTNQWVLNMPIPEEPGTHDITITASHDGATASVTQEVTVSDVLQFDVNVPKTMVNPGSTVSFTVSAVHEGEPLDLDAGDIGVTFDGDDIIGDVTVTDTSGSSTTFTVELPERDPGAYDLTVELDRNGVPSASRTFTVKHPVRITGAFVDQDDDPVSFTLDFSQDDVTEHRFSGNGAYDEKLTPGVYNVTMDFNDAVVRLYNVDVGEWEDPVRYAAYGGSAVPGFALAGLYAYQSALSYDDARLTLRYNAGNVDNPEELEVYRCRGWNVDKASCYTDWEEVSASFSTVNNRVHVNTEVEGAYAIGRRDALQLKYAVEELKASYTPDDELYVTGLVRNAAGDRVPNASVSLSVDDADISTRTWTDGNGAFDFTVAAPEEQGSYTAELTAVQDPYRDGGASFTFDVQRPPNIDIVAPQNVRTRANTSKNVTIYVENNGFAEITDLAPVLDDVPFADQIIYDEAPLQIGDNREFTLVLAVPANASAKTHTAEIVFSYKGEERSAAFGVTVDPLEDAEVEENASSETVIGMISRSIPSVSAPGVGSGPLLPSTVSLQSVVVAIIALQVGIVLFFTVRGRAGGAGAERDHVIRTVNGIKREVRQHQRDRLTPGARNAFWRRSDGVERDQVLRTMTHIKDQIVSGS